METLDNQAPAPNDLGQLQSECDSLRNLLTLSLVLIIVVSGSLSLFLWRQVSVTRQELEEYRPQVAMMLNRYQKQMGPATENFIRKLLEYSKTHPDFTPTLTKFGIKSTSPTAAPGPAPAVSPKK